MLTFANLETENGLGLLSDDLDAIALERADESGPIGRSVAT